ncbi:hypothetical protein [Tenacibaculum halocynthiae]|uniref:hypothetical protein n=1 Tax=Tenacibaculum halocynthiae TaxID=1254437 RepID=UPI003D662CB2
MLSENYYIELAEIVHKFVFNWDPVDLIKNGTPEDEYDLLEKRFLSGIINSVSEIKILKKVKGNLNQLGLEENELTANQINLLDSEIRNIIGVLREKELELRRKFNNN